MPQYNGIQAGHCVITKNCRKVRSHSGAWQEACRRLQEEYDKICYQRPDIDECDFHLALVLETPRHKAAELMGEQGGLQPEKPERSWQPLSDKRLEEIIADTELDAPVGIYSAADVYRLAREVEASRRAHGQTK